MVVYYFFGEEYVYLLIESVFVIIDDENLGLLLHIIGTLLLSG